MTTVHLLHAGYASDRVGSSVVLVRDGDALIVVDPGMVARRGLILDPLASLGVAPEAVTHVFLSHHHPDHTINVALFPSARVHDHWAIYDFAGRWDDVECEGRELSPSIRLIRTTGHTDEDLSTVVGTPDGVVVLTHLWWTDAIPAEDPYAPDPAVLHASRARVLGFADVIVPGHGTPFSPSESTPR